MPPLPPPITSRTNARVKALRQAFSGRASDPGDLTGLEGEHLLVEAQNAGLELETLFVREGDEDLLNAHALRKLKAQNRIVLGHDVFDSVVHTTTPQGIGATVRIPEVKVPQRLHGAGPVLVLEDLQDPGNVGTLIRSAAAFGAVHVFLTPGCPNPWSPKVLRASAGAVFRVPVSRRTMLQAITLARRSSRRVFAAVPKRQGATPAMDARLTECAILIGNEGKGLTPQAISLADEGVTIPCLIESFNAAIAGSLLLYEGARQALEHMREPSPRLSAAELKMLADLDGQEPV